MKNETFKITAEHDFGVGTPTKIEICDVKGTFAEALFRSVEFGFWDGVKGCKGCAFEDTEVWEMPCKLCKRICKDYWRKKHDE